MSDARLQLLQRDIAALCVEVEDMFNVPVFVTVLVRNPGCPAFEADVLVTNDPDDGALRAALEARLATVLDTPATPGVQHPRSTASTATVAEVGGRTSAPSSGSSTEVSERGECP